MVRKKPENDLKMKIYNESLSRGKIYNEKYIYWKKKKRLNLSDQLKKKSKDMQLVGQKKKKTPFGLLSYNAKSAQYWVEQNSNDDYLVS